VNIHKKYLVKFHEEVDADIPWEFYPQQKEVYVNAGETCLIFYKARNKSDKPIVGISIYDVTPQVCALYFNKIQCFCFENQMLGPYEEVDLPVFFYIDPAITEDELIQNSGYYQMHLKYTFYYAKKQDMAKIMAKRLQEEKDNEAKLNAKKVQLNIQHGKDIYKLTNNTTLPGVNPELRDYFIQSGNNGDKFDPAKASIN